MFYTTQLVKLGVDNRANTMDNKMETTDAKMGEEPVNLMEVLVVLDKWTRTCDVVLASLDEQINKWTDQKMSELKR